MITTEVWVRYTVEGWHNWPDAPPHRDYLAAPHRHLFHVEVRVPVTHSDREVEFHDLLAFCRESGRGPGGHMGRASCEMMAAKLAVGIVDHFNVSYTVVTISEDGECGATLTYEREP